MVKVVVVRQYADKSVEYENGEPKEIKLISVIAAIHSPIHLYHFHRFAFHIGVVVNAYTQFRRRFPFTELSIDAQLLLSNILSNRDPVCLSVAICFRYPKVTHSQSFTIFL